MSKYNDSELWNDWKDSNFKNKKKFRALLKSIDPIIQFQVNKWAPPTLPRSTIEAEAINLAIDALPKYDPGRKVKLNTFLTHKLNKLSRYVYKNQNMGHIPEHRILKIDGFNKAKAILKDRLNREPNAVELADELSLPLVEITRLESELAKNVITSDLISSHATSKGDTSELDTLLDFVYYELTAEEKLVYEYSLGKNGKRMLNGKAIAKKMRISPSKVTRIKASIEKKINEHRGGL